MLVPLGFGQRSTVTSLGRMVYYTAEKTPWIELPTSSNVGLTPQLEIPAVTIGLIRQYLSLLTVGS